MGSIFLPANRVLSRAGWRGTPGKDAFSLIEMLVAIAILIAILTLVFSALNQVSAVWRRSSDQIQAFQDARLAFEVLTRNLSQATLNTYLDYDNATSPTRYLRKSELKFLCQPTGVSGLPGTTNTGQSIFFQAPRGYTESATYKSLDSLLNTCGYYVQFGQNPAAPAFVSGSNNLYRYRLMQVMVPTEMNAIYTSTGTSWISAGSNLAMPIAENVIALIFRPQDPGTVTNSPSQSPNDSYVYDSKENEASSPQPITANQLPPVIQVTMVAIDERSAKRIAVGTSEPDAIRNALNAKFIDPANYDKDLAALTGELVTGDINYRIFSSAVPIRETKWSK